MAKNGKIIFLLLTTMGLQIKTYCAPTERSNVFKKVVDMYKTFPLSGAGYLFSPNGEKVDIDEFDGYSIGIKLLKKNFISFLTQIPHKKISNIIWYFLYFRSFYVDLIKSLKFCETIYTVYHKGRHSVSRTPFFDIDCGYVLKKEHINAAFSKVDGKIEGDNQCAICLKNVVSNSNDIIVGHKDVKDKNKLTHFHHKECVERWINDYGTCPYCKQIFGKEIAEGKDDGGKFYAWIDIFRLSLQFVKYTYEYAFTKNKDFHCSFRSSICPLIFSSRIPTIFCRHFSLKKYNGKVEENEFTFSWEDFFSMFSFPDFLNISLCAKISIGVIFFIQKIGALFELTYIKDFYKKTYEKKNEEVNVENNEAILEENAEANAEENVAPVKVGEEAAVNEKKGYKFEFKITILINKDIQ